VLLPFRAQAPALPPSLFVTRLALVRSDGTVSPQARALRVRGAADGVVFDDLWLETAGAADATGTPWQCGPLRLRGRWALVRYDARGELVAAYSHAGARLTADDALVTLATLGD
jgi:hypothetical protein